MFFKIVIVGLIITFWAVSVCYAWKSGQKRGYSDCLIAVRHNMRMEHAKKVHAKRYTDIEMCRYFPVENRPHAEAESVRVVTPKEEKEC